MERAMTTEEAKADMKRQIEYMKKSLADKVKTTQQNRTKAVTLCCAMVEGTAKKLMTDTITALDYENPVTGNKIHNKRPRSIPGEAPAPDKGTLRQSITHDVTETASGASGKIGSTITSPPYGAYLEHGTSRMAPRPWLLPAMDINKAKIEKVLRSVFTWSDSSAGIENAE
jgi:HK97 gp10 family phage protein